MPREEEAHDASSYTGRGPALAESLFQLLLERKEQLVLAESLSAGLASDLLARIPGASDVLWGSYVCYRAEAKMAMLGLSEALIQEHGTVSSQAAGAMAASALEKSGASWALSLTGLAGPGGDDRGNPLGTLWIGLAGRGRIGETRHFLCTGDRPGIRETAAAAALGELIQFIQISIDRV
ncbi:MAG: nicotinamide-nucleotide amidohydrolase family protein [Treponema sp.]|nr:nicotinamide-nucleotide amidohydrolase family protein [Treponema sp.]